MNLGQIQAAIQNLGYGTDTVAQQTYFINACYHEVCSSDRWPFLEKQTTASLPIATAQLTGLPTDVIQYDSVRFFDTLGNPYNCDNIEPQSYLDKFFDYVVNGQPTGPPEYWTIINQGISVFPVADQTYTAQINYIYEPPDLVGSTDTPVLPTSFHDVLVFGAAKNLSQRERDIYSTETWDGEFQRKLSKMREAYLLRQRQNSSKVGKSGFFDRASPSRIWW